MTIFHPITTIILIFLILKIFSPSVVKIPKVKSMKLKSKVGMGRWSGSSSTETKLSCIRTKLERHIMTESLWNKNDISQIDFKLTFSTVRRKIMRIVKTNSIEYLAR